MNKKLIAKAQNELNGLLAHGTSELDVLESLKGDPEKAADFMVRYAKRNGYTIDRDNLRDYFAHLKSTRSQAAAALGSLGGSSTSEAKRKASAENGKLGGRPKKKSRN